MKLGLSLALVLVLALAAPEQPQSIRIVPLARDGQLLVSFELSNGFTDIERTVIRSGLTMNFQYEVDLRIAVPLWVDWSVDSARVTARVEYDNLTRQHRLALEINGRNEQAIVTENEQVVRRWVTTFDRLPLFETSQLQPNREYYVRVRSLTRPPSSWVPWRWADGASGFAKFTFIQ